LEVPPPLGSIVFSLLEKEKEKRPSSAEEVLQTLDGSRKLAMETPPRGRRGIVLAAVAVALVAAVTASVVPLPWKQVQGLKDAEAGSGAPEVRPEAARPPVGAAGQAARLRCSVCGASYLPGERVGDMCHGEPLISE
jgi:hypothetical protein